MLDLGQVWEATFSEESENPPATKDPSCEIDEQFKLEENSNKKINN